MAWNIGSGDAFAASAQRSAPAGSILAARRAGRNVAAAAVIVHFVWIQKSDINEPLRWALWLGVLLGLRIVFAIRKRRARVRLPVTA